jgi:DNA polymerase-3 subunit alpha (Gram-positive type)
VAYVMMAFRIAYFKVYRPEAFYAAYFTVRATDFDADLIVQGVKVLKNKLVEFEQKGNSLTAKEKGLLTIIEMAIEMYLRGFIFYKVDLNNSDATRFLIKDKGLLPPLASLQGLGTTAAQNIVSARKDKPFSSQVDLKIRARVSKTVIEILEGHGCLNDLPVSDQIQLFG